VIASPLVVRGEATGYEGTVLAQVRQDGMRAGESLGEAVGIAGSMGALGPLELDVAFRPPTEPTGALVLTTDTGLGGVGVPEATVVRVAFAEVVERTEGGAAAPCAAPAPPGPVDDDSMEVVVYLACEAEVATNPDAGADEVFVAVTRVVPRSVGVLRAALGELLSGTTPSEEEAGLTSIFSADTADVLGDVTIDDGTAVIDLRATVDNASTSAGSLVFSGQLNRTVFQFPTVERVEYRLDGSCEAFWEWLQVGGCQVVERDDG
jgi:hypothetical protein